MVLIAVLGLALASYLVYVHYSGTPPACTAGGVAGQAQQTISGTIDAADSGLTVTIYDGTIAVGTATPAANGTGPSGPPVERAAAIDEITHAGSGEWGGGTRGRATTSVS